MKGVLKQLINAVLHEYDNLGDITITYSICSHSKCVTFFDKEYIENVTIFLYDDDKLIGKVKVLLEILKNSNITIEEIRKNN